MSIRLLYVLALTFKALERVEVFMCKPMIRLASALVHTFSCALHVAGEVHNTNNKENPVNIKKRCTDANITQKASAFG